MSTQESPLQTLKRLYGEKEKLVDSLVGSLRDGDEDEGELKQRLLKASNKKLLRLAEVSKTIKAEYGSKDKLAETVASLLGKAKDADYVAKLKGFAPGRLLDMATSRARAAKRASN